MFQKTCLSFDESRSLLQGLILISFLLLSALAVSIECSMTGTRGRLMLESLITPYSPKNVCMPKQIQAFIDRTTGLVIPEHTTDGLWFIAYDVLVQVCTQDAAAVSQEC